MLFAFRRRVCLFIFSFFLPLSLFGQQYNFKIFLPKHGLANSSINNIFQDSRGYLWFATQGGGVSRFDGKQFRNFTKADQLAGNDVTYISEDKEGNIWFATYGDGVSKFDGKTFTTYTEKNGLANNTVYSILCDSKGKLWFCTFGGGISRFEGDKFFTINKKTGLPADSVFCIYEDKKGIYWIGTYKHGLCRYDGKSFKVFDGSNGLPHVSVFTLMEDSKGTLWIGSAGDGISSFDGNKFIRYPLPELVKNDLIGDITEDKRGNIWVAAEHGLLKIRGINRTLFTEKQGLSSNTVQALCSDYEGNLWIGTLNGGAVLFRNEAFVTFTEKDGMPNNKATSICTHNRKNYLFGTAGGGLAVYDGEKLCATCVKELSGMTVTTVAEDKSGKVWVGTEASGVFVMAENKGNQYSTVRKIEKQYGIPLLSISKILAAKDGKIWIACYGKGVFVFDKDSVFHFSSTNGLPNDNAWTLFEDRKGRIWIGMIQAGAVMYDGIKFTVFSEQDGLADNSVSSICEDNRGRILLGTIEGGISVFDGKNFKNIGTREGLCSNYINALLSDRKGFVWAGTDKGVNKIRFSENDSIIFLKYYSENEGFKGMEVNPGALFEDREGTIWIGTVNGLTRYNPVYDYPNTTAPKVLLTGIKLSYQEPNWKKLGQTVNDKTGLPDNPELSYKNHHLTFNFQALTSDQVQYTYQLEGLEENWSPPSPKNEATYPNIPPGKKYVFRVRAVNSDGVWSKEEVAYTFSITPPFWQTAWFYTLVALIAAGAVYGFINWRTAQLAREKKILEEKVTERTIELRDANKQLSLAYRDIKDSIQYAKQIQDAILPLDEDVRRALPDSFVFFKPRETVSGDFFWFNERGDMAFIAAVDCTGHGVPGAFMSMIGNTLLNEIVNEKLIVKPGDILNQLQSGIRKSLKQDRESFESKDGMDIAVCMIDKKNKQVQYAGAKRPFYLFRKEQNGELLFEEIKANRFSIGGLQTEENPVFSNHEMSFNKGDTFYIFTDGFPDQFGGEKEKKYSTKRLQELLMRVHPLSMQAQKAEIGKTFEAWKASTEQTDDVLVVGVRMQG